MFNKINPIVPYQKKTNKALKTQYELIRNLELSFEKFKVIKELADKIGLNFYLLDLTILV